MEKVNFKNLLTDLYNIYNPANIQYVDDLVERYNRIEFDALKNIFIKYNRKSASYYDPSVGTDDYIYNLIKEYEAGLRSLENVTLQDRVIEKPEVIEKQEVLDNLKGIQEAQKEIKKEVAGEVDKKIQSIEKSFSERDDVFKTQLEEIYKDFEKKLQTLKESNDDVTIRIFSTYSNSELDLPNKKIIAGLGKGSRLIIKDKDGKTMGMEI
ncbi:MAG: hypothetical protein WC303_03605, partial [Candidatus Paceibacterota bacterium]